MEGKLTSRLDQSLGLRIEIIQLAYNVKDSNAESLVGVTHDVVRRHADIF